MASETYRDGRLVARADDTARTVTEWDDRGVETSRPYTPAEDTAADLSLAAAATLTDLAARVARIEAHLWPPTPGPAPGTPPKGVTWDDLGGVWPVGVLLDDGGGRVWRNVAGVPLTTPPSKFPGEPSRWAHLFVAVVAQAPDHPAEWQQPTGAHDAYPIGAHVTHNGQTWESTVAANTWEPGVYGWVTI